MLFVWRCTNQINFVHLYATSSLLHIAVCVIQVFFVRERRKEKKNEKRGTFIIMVMITVMTTTLKIARTMKMTNNALNQTKCTWCCIKQEEEKKQDRKKSCSTKLATL